MRYALITLFCLLAAACASFDGRGLAPGASAVQVESVMGPAVDKRVHGNETWVYYPRQPYGLRNYVARIGADGRLIAIEQRLTDDNVAKIVRGKTQRAEVEELLGPPYKVWHFPRMPRDILEYRMVTSAAGSIPQGLYVQATPDGVVREVFMENDPDNRLSDGGGGSQP
jgi:hypothetical protein